MLLINAPLIDLWENSLFTEKPERSEIPKLTGQVSLIYTLYQTNIHSHKPTLPSPAPLHCPSQTTASPSHSSPPPSPNPSTPSAESCPLHSWGSRLQTALRP